MKNGISEIGNRAYTARTNRSLKQDHVSEAIGVNQSTYSRFECGKYDMPISKIIKLCHVLDVSISWLIGETVYELTLNEQIELEQYEKYLLSKRQ